ncbi:MAG: hypothetical protein O7E51_07625, partial [Acidobacteria bacterium]|nr:hypothetical protein [Acidobacteriota bacterium]
VSGPGAEANFREHSADCILQAAEEAEEGKDSVAGSKERKQEREKAAHFFVALCSNRPLDPARPLLYLPSTGNVLREREIHIHLLTNHLTQAREQVTAQMVHFQQQEQKLEQLLEERTQWAWSLQQEMEQARAAFQKLHQEFEERTQWAWSLQQEMEQARAALQKLHQEFEERTAWALNLKEELEQRWEELRLLYGSLWYRIGKNLRLSPIPASDQKPPQAVKPDDS